MMGMVFTEFLDMVESKFSLDMVAEMVERAGARGSDTSVGNYDDEELVKIVVALGEESEIPVPCSRCRATTTARCSSTTSRRAGSGSSRRGWSRRASCTSARSRSSPTSTTCRGGAGTHVRFVLAGT